MSPPPSTQTYTDASVERYGVFMQINGTQGRHGRGLVPVAETGTPRGADLRKAFPVGMEVEAKILAMLEDPEIGPHIAMWRPL